MTSVVAGIGWHIIGACMAGSFYAPIEKVRNWAWETSWAVAGIFSWVFLPIGVSLMLLPRFHDFFVVAGTPLIVRVAIFGAMWGVGNVTYGLTMRHLGMALGIGVAIGVTLIVGTLVPPILHGQAAALFTTKSGILTMVGIFTAFVGVGIVSWSGHLKEIELKGHLEEFNVGLGLLLAVLCGLFSSGMSFAIDAAQPMQAMAIAQGVSPLYSALPSYTIIMGGGAIVNFGYCFIRLGILPRLSIQADFNQPNRTLAKNALLATSGGIMWYLQFFFYAWGAANIPNHLSYVNWMLHMSIYVLCGAFIGLAVGEWIGVSTRPRRLLWTGVAIIIIATNLVGLGMAS